jgi:hypothetical protein
LSRPSAVKAEGDEGAVCCCEAVHRFVRADEVASPPADADGALLQMDDDNRPGARETIAHRDSPSNEALIMSSTVRTPRRLLAAASATVLALAAVCGVAAAEIEASGLRVAVSCFSNPEKVRVTNVSSRSITITRVGSIYEPNSSEPYSKTRTLGAGNSITFFSGAGASSSNVNTLTRSYIFNNDVGTAEGARVRTSSGNTYSDRCG